MKRLLIDIETAPHVAYIWGPKNTYISPDNVRESGYTMCFAAKWYGKRGIEFHSVRDGGDMVKAAWELLNEADAVIHYNGTKFDIPTLNADFLDRRLGPPAPYHEIDLLKTSRRRFRRYSHKLDSVAKRLGVGGKVQHKGLELWTDCMAGCDKAWRIMERYNRQDVKLLEDVYNKFLPWIQTHPNHALYTETDRPVCTNCGSERMTKQGRRHTKTQSYQQFKCKDCGTWLRARTTCIPPDKRQDVLVQA